MPTPSSSSVIIASCASCERDLAASSAISAARSPGRPISRPYWNGRSRAPSKSVPSNSASAGGSSIPSTHPRSNASARARPARPTNSASRPRSSPPMPALPAASLCSTPRRCQAIPYDGHTLSGVIDATEKLTGCAIERAYVDKGYRGHHTAHPYRVFISGQKRGVFGLIKRELRRRSAIEAVIGHMKMDGHLGRCYLKGRDGDAANPILTAVGHNFRQIPLKLLTFLQLRL